MPQAPAGSSSGLSRPLLLLPQALTSRVLDPLRKASAHASQVWKESLVPHLPILRPQLIGLMGQVWYGTKL